MNKRNTLEINIRSKRMGKSEKDWYLAFGKDAGNFYVRFKDWDVVDGDEDLPCSDFTYEISTKLSELGFTVLKDKILRLEFKESDVSHGNEDWWSLCFNQDNGDFFVWHSWSHRKSGSITEFVPGSEIETVQKHKGDIASKLGQIGLEE